MILQIPAINLIQNRFDIRIKYLYGKYRKFDGQLKEYEEIYKEHLFIWNGFKEFNDDGVQYKSTFDDFKNEFDRILDSISLNGFDPTISLIPTVNLYPVNGAHRIASCLLYKKSIYHKPLTSIPKVNYYDEKYFEKKGLNKDLIKKINIDFEREINEI